MTTILLLAALGSSARADTFTAALNAGHHSLRQAFQQARLVQASWGAEERALLDALKDPNPGVRVQALKGLKNYVAFNSATRERVIGTLEQWNETPEVRREAARALAAASHDSRAKDALLKRAQDWNTPASVRAMAYKALYWQVQYDGSLLREVLQAAESESSLETRLGAIWALMYAGNDSTARRTLLELASRAWEPSVRREAARSLYQSVVWDSDVRRFAREQAERGHGELRYVGIMLLTESHDSSDKDLLERIAQRDSDGQARRYAVTALAGWSLETIHFFHLNHYEWVGRVRRLVSEAIDRE